MSNQELTINPITGDLQKITKDSVIETLQNNNVINAFDIANIGEKVMYQMDDQIIEDYQDLSGIDLGNSSGYQHDNANDLIEPLSNELTRFLCHFNGTDGQGTTIDSAGNHTITLHGTAQLDTAQKKWGTASGLFDGNSDYASMPDSVDWDFLANSVDDWTVDFWVRHYGTPGGELYFIQADGSKYIGFGHFGGQFWLGWRMAGDTDAYGGSITDTNWHHLVFCKVGNKVAIYKDGIQVVYNNATNLGVVNGNFYIGGNGLAYNQFFKGNIDEFRVHKANYFYADPNVGLTDTISVPIIPYDLITPNIIIQSKAFTADTDPSELSIIMREEDVDAITLNTDLTIEGSRNDGINWTQGTLEELGDQVGSQRNLKANIDVSGQPSGTLIKYKYKSFGKNLKFHAISESWKI